MRLLLFDSYESLSNSSPAQEIFSSRFSHILQSRLTQFLRKSVRVYVPNEVLIKRKSIKILMTLAMENRIDILCEAFPLNLNISRQR